MKVITALLFLFLSGCSHQESATYMIPKEGSAIEISIIRRASHPALAEFDRELKLRVSGAEKAAFQLIPDTGGTVLVNTYVDSSKERVLLTERTGCYLVDLAGASLRQGCPAQIKKWNFAPKAYTQRPIPKAFVEKVEIVSRVAT